MVQQDRDLAGRIWPVLLALALERRTITYGQLGERVGADPRFEIPRGLDPIQEHCDANNLPPLTIIVVSAATGRPSKGFLRKNLGREDEVFTFRWERVENPFA